jgi:hypothetical protein
VDYAIALEAVLMFEHDFINRLLKRRALALLAVSGVHATEVAHLVGRFYGYRSTIAHGDPLPIAKPQAFHTEMWKFEGLIRDVLRTALHSIPGPPMTRRTRLLELGTITDSERIEQISQKVKDLEDSILRERLLNELTH